MKRILLGAMVFVLSSVQAHAQTSCSDFTIEPDQQVASCTTQLIASPKGPLLRITRADELPFSLYLNRGAAFARKGEIERSKADFRRAIEVATKSLEEGGPPLPSEYNNRCWARAVANVELDLALADCNEALRSAPRNAASLDSRAFVYLRLGRNEDAIRDYDAALNSNAILATSLYGRGVAKLRLGAVEGAKADFFLAETFGPGTRARLAAFGITEYAVLEVAQFVPPKPDGLRDVSMARYASASFADGEEGIVGLRVQVRRDGSVAGSQIETSSGHPRLDRAAQNLVKDWRYHPATLNDVPVEALIPANITWSLQILSFNMSKEQAGRLSAFYPQASVKAGEQGISVVRFLVAPNGTVATAVIDLPSGVPRLDIAALTMIRSWRLTPTTGESVGGWFRTAIVWTIPGKRLPSGFGDCGTTIGQTFDVDVLITICTQFLERGSLTNYERAKAYKRRAMAYGFNREFDLAMADYDQAIRTSPLAAIFVERAHTLWAQGKRDLAFSDFDTPIQAEPLSYLNYMARAHAYFELGQMEQASRDFDSGIRVTRTPDQPDAYSDRCYFLGLIGKAEVAVSDCNKSLSLRPRDLDTLYKRGFAYFKLGQYQRAIQDFNAALDINARAAASLYARGVAKVKLGDSRGEPDIAAAKEINPRIAEEMLPFGINP